MIDVQAAAVAANVSTRTIRRWIAAGMPSTLVNGQRRIDPDDLHHEDTPLHHQDGQMWSGPHCPTLAVIDALKEKP